MSYKPPLVGMQQDRRAGEISRMINDILAMPISDEQQYQRIFAVSLRRCYSLDHVRRELAEQRSLQRWLAAKREYHSRKTIDHEL
jgi:hypothetical protein